MKIGFFVDTYLPQLNGLATSVYRLAKELRKQGHTVYVFAPKIDDYKDEDKFVYRIPSISLLRQAPEARAPIMLPKHIFQTLKMLDLDLIHAHGNGIFSLIGKQIAHYKKIPFFLTFHTQHDKYTHYILKGRLLKPKMVERLMKIWGNISDGIVVPTKKIKDELERYGVKRPITIVPNFIDFDSFENVQSGFLRQKLKIPQKDIIFLSVGRLGKEKNFPFLIKAFVDVAHKHPNTHLVIAGYGVEKEHLEQLAKENPYVNRIHFPGKVELSEIPKVYKDADVFVFASTTETQGVCVLEAASSHLPIIVVNDGAFEGMVEYEKNGYVSGLVENEFADYMKLLAKDAEKRKKFGDASYEIAHKNFDPKVLVEKLVDFYDTISKEYKPSHGGFSKITNIAFRIGSRIAIRIYSMQK